MLIIFGGLPATGKTTISKEIARKLKAVYLRIDTIEHTLKNSSPHATVNGPEGYLVSYAIAKDNLRLGLNVVADSVNPNSITRNDWQEVARKTSTKFFEIELICSDKKEHRRRVENRIADINEFKLPTWQDVIGRDYEPWLTKSLTIDTSNHTIDESIQTIMEFIEINA